MRNRNIQLVIGGLISLIALGFVFSTIDLSLLWKSFLSTNWLYGIPFVVITMVSFYWRAFRWRLLLNPPFDVPSSRLFGPLMIGMGFNGILPGRVGELARPYALMKAENVPYGTGLSTVFIERLVDGITLLVLFALLPFYATVNSDISYEWQGWKLDAAFLQDASIKISLFCGVLAAGFIALLFRPVEEFASRVIHALPMVPKWLLVKVDGLFRSFTAGAKVLKNPYALVMVVFHSVVIWFSVAFSFQMMSWGFESFSISFGEAMAFLIATCLFISIPSSPGFWGVYEAGGMVALLFMGVVANTEEGRSDAIAFTMIVHFLQWAPITAVGLWYAAKLHISASDAQVVAPAATSTDKPGEADPTEPSKIG